MLPSTSTRVITPQASACAQRCWHSLTRERCCWPVSTTHRNGGYCGLVECGSSRTICITAICARHRAFALILQRDRVMRGCAAASGSASRLIARHFGQPRQIADRAAYIEQAGSTNAHYRGGFQRAATPISAAGDLVPVAGNRERPQPPQGLQIDEHHRDHSVPDKGDVAWELPLILAVDHRLTFPVRARYSAASNNRKGSSGP